VNSQSVDGCYNCIARGNHASHSPSRKIEKRLDRLAKRNGRTKTFYAREAILQYLDDLEDIYFAGKALADIRSGKSQPVPIEKVMRRYGLER
jgi:RHH-type rel operon transcriptional repressor/antitoxin RelB